MLEGHAEPVSPAVKERAEVQVACDRCTQGVMDSTNPHLTGECGCECHAADRLPDPAMDRRELPPEHPARRQVEEGSAAARAAMPSVKLPLPPLPWAEEAGKRLRRLREDKALLAERVRDKQHIAQLTEALDARPITREHAFRAAQNAVRNQGYAVALHGSQIKDLDLIAVPWQDTALTAQDVAELIAAAIPGFIEKGSPEARPNGRLSFTIRPNWHYGFDHWWIDLSVMPRERDWPARAVLAGEEAT
jgi:hypothetical protein